MSAAHDADTGAVLGLIDALLDDAESLRADLAYLRSSIERHGLETHHHTIATHVAQRVVQVHHRVARLGEALRQSTATDQPAGIADLERVLGVRRG